MEELLEERAGRNGWFVYIIRVCFLPSLSSIALLFCIGELNTRRNNRGRKQGFKRMIDNRTEGNNKPIESSNARILCIESRINGI